MAEKKQISSKELSQKGRKELCAKLGLNMLVYKAQADWLFQQLEESYDVNLDLLFRVTIISMDLCASIRACMRYENSYERRYHIKYLIVNLYEAYTACFNEASDKKSYIAKWVAHNSCIKEDEDYMALCKELENLKVQLHDDIKVSRNSYAHYDDDPIDTVKSILSINSEERPTKLCCDLLKVFEMIKQVCEKQHKMVIEESALSVSYANIIYSNIRNQLRNNKALIKCVNEVSQNTEQRLRKASRIFQCFKKFGGENQKLVLLLMRIHILIQIMRADFASAIKACIYADSDVECVLQIRRLTIIRQEGIGHLQELWSQIPIKYINTEDEAHIDAIKNMVIKGQRNKLLHYRYQNKDYIKFCYAFCSNGYNIIDGLTDGVPFLNELNALQLSLTHKLLKVRNKIAS